MIKAILFDLDNTLLYNLNETFAPEYLRLAEGYFVEQWNFSGMAQVLLATIRAMTGQRDMQTSNTDVALAIVQHATQRTLDEIRDAFAGFYAKVYPALKSCVAAIPGVADLIRYLQARNYAVVIATNPIYPAEAIRQRLAWAGLSDDLSDYALVTNSDTMHFAKPNPAYYAEILAQVGIEPDEAVMVGDSLQNDIIPAETLGLQTYHTPTPDALHRFYEHISTTGWLDSLTPRPLNPTMIEPQFRGNVGALFGMLATVKPHFWMQRPDPNEWSILQVVCHLLESENTVQRSRLQRILAEPNPFLVNPRPPGPNIPLCGDDGYRVAQQFVQARQETIALLASLQRDDWQRPARHSVFGNTTLLEMAHFTAQHDRLHLNQLCETLGNCQ